MVTLFESESRCSEALPFVLENKLFLSNVNSVSGMFLFIIHVTNVLTLVLTRAVPNNRIFKYSIDGSNIRRKKIQLPQKIKFTWNYFFSLLGFPLSPHHPLIYICKPILLAMLFT